MDLMDVTISAVSDDGDDLRSLRQWLIDEDELRGRVQLMVPAPQQGTLGSVADVLVAALGSGGAVTVLISVLVSWIRHRTHDVTIEVTRQDGTSIRIEAKRVRGAPAEGLQELVTTYAKSLQNGSDEDRGDG